MNRAEINRVPDQNIRMKVCLIELQNYENENDNSMIFVGKSRKQSSSIEYRNYLTKFSYYVVGI